MSERSTTGRPTCGHCGLHPAIVEINGLPLCVDCNARVQAAERDRIETALQVGDELSRMINYFSAEAEAAVGLPGLVPRIALRQPTPVVQTGPMTFQNVNIHDNAIGVLNTGTIQHLDARIGEVRTGGNSELAEALKAFVETAANAEELDPADREELLEQVDLILEQARAPESARKPGLLRGAIRSIAEIATTVTAVGTAWSHLEPLLRAAFPFLFS